MSFFKLCYSEIHAQIQRTLVFIKITEEFTDLVKKLTQFLKCIEKTGNKGQQINLKW